MKDIRQPRSHAAVVVLIDAHSAIIAHCADGLLTRIRTVRAPKADGTSDHHMGDSPRQSYHPGTRGETATDAAQRARAEARREFISHLSPIVARTAPAELIVVGGNRLFAGALGESIAKSHGRAAIVAHNLHRALAAEAIVERVTTAVEAHLAEQDLSDVQMLLERTGAHTTGVVGPVAALDAAEHGAVDAVLMTPNFQARHARAAEQIVSATRAQNGRVMTVAEHAARLLDKHAGGVGALLRFALHKIPADLGERGA